ncbi:MAG TPA: STN and carboxypeptidase regulatory-like domain-containing protein, partial [Niastella sp.]|nr:STN and carboxypeptidase regulatory-like domain-containing protein [Niastella sp.]
MIQVTLPASAQNLLNKTISLEVKQQRLANVLEILSNKGNFYFSYNSSSIEQDSLVTLTAINKSVEQVLELLLPDNYEFRESGNYIIIRKAPIRMTFLTNKAVAEDKFYTISGYVLDDESGNWIHNASIYEKRLLNSTLSNSKGYFKLRFKEKTKAVALTVSKEFYRDTTFAIDAGYNQQVSITLLPVTSGLVTIISPDDYFAPEQLKVRVRTDTTITEYTYTKTDSVKVERRGIGRFLVSSQQRLQSINLKQFFISRPFQVSFTPGLGTHGHLSAQVSNNISFNILGGYNGGVNGFELGGLFNIDKKSVQYAQIAGLFNTVGGSMKGLQVAGLNNTVLDSASGFQAGGISNIVTGKFSGFQ